MKTNEIIEESWVPQDGFNSIFSKVDNCEIEDNPAKDGYSQQSLFFRKRDGYYTDRTALNVGKRRTQGNIVNGRLQNQKIYYYTDEGFVYNFDGVTNRAVIVNDNNIESTNTGSNFSFNVVDKYVGQTFTFTDKTVVPSVKFRIRSVGTLQPQSMLRLYVTSSDKSTIILSSPTIVDSQLVLGSYSEIGFDLLNQCFLAGQEYFFYLKSENIDSSNYFDVEYSTTSGSSSGVIWEKTGSGSWTSGTGDLYFKMYGTKPLFYDQSRLDDILSVSYLGGGKFGGVLTIQAYSTASKTITLTAPLVSPSSYVGKIIYIETSSSSPTPIRQRKFIVAAPSATELQIDSDFNVNPSTWSGTTASVYNKITAQLWFNQLRKGSTGTADNDYLYAVDIDENDLYWYFPQSKSIISFDNRIVYMKLDGTGIIGSTNESYEIPDVNTAVSFGNDVLLSFTKYSGYIILFFKNKIGLIKKVTISETAGTFIYKYQDLFSEGIYSEKSFLVQGGLLYIVSNDAIFYSVDLSFISLGEVFGKLSDQGQILINFFRVFQGGSVQLQYNRGDIWISYKNGPSTEIHKYYTRRQGWIRDVYPVGGNMFNFVYTIGSKVFFPKGNNIFVRGGISDDGVNIRQYIKLRGPIQFRGKMGRLEGGSLITGFDEHGLGGMFSVSYGGFYREKRNFYLDKLAKIGELNRTVLGSSSIGSAPIGETGFGGNISSSLSLSREKYNEQFNLFFKLSKFIEFFTFELINDTEFQFYFGGVSIKINPQTPSDMKGDFIIPGDDQ